MALVTRNKKGWPCECERILENEASLVAHVVETGHMRAQTCTVCRKFFATRKGLHDHRNQSRKHKANENAQKSAKKPKILWTPPPTKREDEVNAKTAMVETTETSVAITPADGIIDEHETEFGGTWEIHPSWEQHSPTSTSATISESMSSWTITSSENWVESIWAAVDSSSVNKIYAALEKQTPPNRYPWASPAVPRDDYINLLMSLRSRCHNVRRLKPDGFPAREWEHLGVIYEDGYQRLPKRLRGVTAAKRDAIAIDCEMVGVASSESAVVKICAVDVFTGEILIDSLVNPESPVTDWRTRVSGVTPAMMSTAKATGRVLRSIEATRGLLSEFADSETILVGHALNHDLQGLKIVHTRIVDTSVLTSKAAFPRQGRTENGGYKHYPRRFGLRLLASELLDGLTIQGSSSGHDCLEDTLATREIILLSLQQPEKLKTWGQEAGERHERERKKREEEQRARALEKQQAHDQEPALVEKEFAQTHISTDATEEIDDCLRLELEALSME